MKRLVLAAGLVAAFLLNPTITTFLESTNPER